MVAAAAAILPLVAWQTPAELGRALAGALLAAALVPVLVGDAAAGVRRAAAGVFGAAWLAALSGLVLLRSAALPRSSRKRWQTSARRAPGTCSAATRCPPVTRRALDRDGRRGVGRGRCAGRGRAQQERGVHPPRT
jgi:hypothetical protein